MSRTKKNKIDSGQNIIANMGLYWDKEKVNWSRQKEALLGVRANGKMAGTVPFWEQTGIYALYDMDYHLVYVGQAGFGDTTYIGDRLKHHTKSEIAGRWDMFSWFGLRKVKKDNTLGVKPGRKSASLAEVGNVLEAILIEVAEPPMNSQRGKFGPKITRYIPADKTADADDKIANKDVKRHEKVLSKISSSNEKMFDELAKLKKTISKTKKQVFKWRRQQ